MSEPQVEETKATFRKKVILPSDKDETKVKIAPKAVPKFEEKTAQVKLNTAAILREEARIKKLEIEENKQLESKLLDLRDSTDFDNWQRQMREKDEIERLEHIQMRKIEMELTREEAIRAMEGKSRENQLQAALLKEKLEILAEEEKEKQHSELQTRKKLVTEVLDNRYNGVEERKKIAKQNQDIKNEIKQGLADKIKMRKEEEAIEQAKRDELIRQIRELESQPIARQKGYDPTEVMGYGLFDEMSLAQLRERLEETKVEREAEVVQRRTQISKAKEEASDKMVEKVQKLTERRQIAQQRTEQVREARKQEEQKKKRMEADARKKGLIEVYDKISKKKKVRESEQKKLERELKEIRLKRQYLKGKKSAAEAEVDNPAKRQKELAAAERERANRIKQAEAEKQAKIAERTVTHNGVVNDYHRTITEGNKNKA